MSWLWLLSGEILGSFLKVPLQLFREISASVQEKKYFRKLENGGPNVTKRGNIMTEKCSKLNKGGALSGFLMAAQRPFSAVMVWTVIDYMIKKCVDMATKSVDKSCQAGQICNPHRTKIASATTLCTSWLRYSRQQKSNSKSRTHRIR